MIDTTGMSKQCTDVINYIIAFGSITGREACIKLGINYLPTRIQDLKKDYLVPIKTVFEKNENNNGYHARYSIAE